MFVPVNPKKLVCAIASWSSLVRKTSMSSTSTEPAAHLRSLVL